MNRKIIFGIIFIITFSVYLSNNRIILTGQDTTPARYLPVSILENFDLNLDEFPHLYEMGTPYFLKEVNGHYYSTYPIGTPLLALPIYGLAKICGFEFTSDNLYHLEKISAALLIALSVGFLFLAFSECVSLKYALILTFIYAFSTNSWAVSSQALWQHTSSQLFNSLVIYFLVKGLKNEKFIPYVGLWVGISIFCRPTNAIVGIIIAIYILLKKRKKFIYFLIGGLIPLSFLLIYNLNIFGNIFGGYAGGTTSLAVWQGNLLSGLNKVLFSPGRGLLIYSPVLILSFIGFFRAIYQKKDIYIFLGIIPILYIILISCFKVWYGGGCFGSRLLTDPLPFFVFLIIPVFNKWASKNIFKTAFLILIIISTGVQILGSYFDDNSWNAEPNINYHEERLLDWKQFPLLYILKDGRMLVKEKGQASDYFCATGIIDFHQKESQKYLGYGWGEKEDWGIWGKGKESLIFINLKGIKERNLIIKATSFTKGEARQIMGIYLNNYKIGEYVFCNPLWDWEEFELKIPAEYFNGNIEELKFVYRHNKRASYNDLRKISVAFEYILIK